jgi:hypothetical protein
MTDRELLELAAKAYGLVGTYVTNYDGGNFYYFGNPEGLLCDLPDGNSDVWNPFTDDGDAQRLAVKLKISVMHNDDDDRDPWVMAQRIDCVEDVNDESQRPAATRRAIVRAAAEIGRAMK